MKPLSVAVLGSTKGSIIPSLLQFIQYKQLPVNIAAILSDKPQAPILLKAEQYKIVSEILLANSLNRVDYDQLLNKTLKKYQMDLILLIGFMRILSKQFVTEWYGKMINVHPSLLPKHAGLMDLAVHQAVLTAKEKESGCTVHLVTTNLDAGPIILQKQCPVLKQDTAESLKARVQSLEALAMGEAIELLITHHCTNFLEII